MTEIELKLLEWAIDEATSPAVKSWVIARLKAADAAATNGALKAVIEALENFLSETAA